MKDVFKYFKYVRSLQESTTSDRAHELGYQYQSRGVWLDPATGKEYKAKGTQFVPYERKVSGKREPASGEGESKKSLGQFKQDAADTQEPTALPQIPDGLTDQEFADAKAKEFTQGRKVTPEREKFLKKAANTQVAMMKQPEEPVEEPVEEPAPAPEPKEEPLKKPEDFKQLDDEAREAGDDSPEQLKRDASEVIKQLSLRSSLDKQRKENNAKRKNSGYHVSSSRKGAVEEDKPGQGRNSTAVQESSVLETAYHMILTGETENDEGTTEIIDKYGYDPKKDRVKYESAWKSGYVIRDALGLQPGESTDEYAFGKFDGQNTDIPDRNRSNVYDDIMQDMVLTAGLQSEEFSKLSDKMKKTRMAEYQKYKRDSADYMLGNTDERPEVPAGVKKIMAMGNKDVATSKGFDPSTTQIKDQAQAGDIYLTKKSEEKKIRENMQKLFDSFGENPQVYNQAVRYYLQKLHTNKDLMAFSLKEVPKDRMANSTTYNTSMTDLAKLVVDPSISDDDLTSKISLDLSQTSKNKFISLSKQDLEIKSKSMPYKTETGGGDAAGKINLLPVRSTQSGDEFKMEPQYEGQAARAGVYSKSKIHELAKEITGYDFNEYVPVTTKSGKTSGNLTEAQKKHWVDTLDNYVRYTERLPDNHYLKLNPDQFVYAGKKMEPKEWIQSVVDGYNTTEDEAKSNRAFRGDQKFNPLMSKAHSNFTLRNLHLLEMFRKRHEEGRDRELFADLMFGSSKVNYKEDDEFYPFTKIY